MIRVYSKERGLKVLKPGIDFDNYREKYPSAIKVKRVPTIKTIEKWEWDGYSKTPCGCKVEPDGSCEHGLPSWTSIILF